MSRPLWLLQLIKKAFPSRFLAARATHVPVLGRMVDRWLFEGDDLIYLPRDRVIEIRQTIALPDEMVLPSRVVEHFIEKANYHWIMNSCICRDARTCEDYPIDLGCLFLGEAVLGINPQLGRLVTKKEALDHVRQCREAGLVHLVGRTKLDTVWLGVGPADKLLTVCNCCPCCCLASVLPAISPRISAKVRRMPGVMVQVGDQCQGCGICTQGICFVQAIHLDGGRAVISDACRGCGRCVDVCPHEAIQISIQDVGFVDQAIARMSALVDVT